MVELFGFERNEFSQFGEDGVLEELLDLIQDEEGSLSKFAIEFGASDGVNCSNTRNLLLNHAFFCVYIESDSSRFTQLEQNTTNLRVLNLKTFIKPSGPSSLQNLMNLHGLGNVNFDLISIDVDGEDYHLMKSVGNMKAKILLVEFNPTIPLECVYIQPKDSGLRHGSSARAIHNLGKELGYSTVYATSCNMFLIRNDLVQRVSSSFTSVNDLRVLVRNAPEPNYIFSGIDGSVIMTNEFLLHWHRVPVTAEMIQVLPKFLRKATGDYSFLRRIIFLCAFKKKQLARKFLKSFFLS